VDEKATILLVDDEIDLLESIAELLTLDGYQVLSAQSGSEGLTLMDQRIPDVIISDVMMQPMNGFEFFGAVRQNPAWISIPFIFVSAHDLRSDPRMAVALGAGGFLPKPFNPIDLLEIVESHLKRIRGL
jgi:CheY-like chemotaxis protein